MTEALGGDWLKKNIEFEGLTPPIGSTPAASPLHPYAGGGGGAGGNGPAGGAGGNAHEELALQATMYVCDCGWVGGWVGGHVCCNDLCVAHLYIYVAHLCMLHACIHAMCMGSNAHALFTCIPIATHHIHCSHTKHTTYSVATQNTPHMLYTAPHTPHPVHTTPPPLTQHTQAHSSPTAGVGE